MQTNHQIFPSLRSMHINVPQADVVPVPILDPRPIIYCKTFLNKLEQMHSCIRCFFQSLGLTEPRSLASTQVGATNMFSHMQPLVARA